MADKRKPVNVHYESAKEHLAGVAAAAAWHRDLMAAHLLDSQNPIKDQSIPPEGGDAP
jgi:hypothetical protein